MRRFVTLWKSGTVHNLANNVWNIRLSNRVGGGNRNKVPIIISFRRIRWGTIAGSNLEQMSIFKSKTSSWGEKFSTLIQNEKRIEF